MLSEYQFNSITSQKSKVNKKEMHLCFYFLLKFWLGNFQTCIRNNRVHWYVTLQLHSKADKSVCDNHILWLYLKSVLNFFCSTTEQELWGAGGMAQELRPLGFSSRNPLWSAHSHPWLQLQWPLLISYETVLKVHPMFKLNISTHRNANINAHN